MPNDLPISQIIEMLECNPMTGEIRWKVKKSPKNIVGELAGGINGDGYVSIKIDGKKYLAHRILFAVHNGRWPTLEIDHIDRNRLNNKIINLREATHQQNNANKMKSQQTRNPFKGVVWAPHAKKWKAQIKVNQRIIYLGIFSSPEVAKEAYMKAAREHFGDFASF